MKVDLKQTEGNKLSASKQFDQLSIPEQQGKIIQFLTAMFKYWVKKKTSKYLRLNQFFKNMVVFGLAPNTVYLEKLFHNYSEKIQQPNYSYVTNTNPKVDKIERAKVKPFNDQFVYRLLRDGTLEITHVSLEVLKDLFKLNKHSVNLYVYLK